MTISREFEFATKRPVVYIASPYTKGDPAINVRFQCEVFDRLLSSGLCWPVAPLWSHFQHTVSPRNYKDWIEYDLAMIAKYDACVRLTSEFGPMNYFVHDSSGADGEVKEFLLQGKPVFYTIKDLLDWARRQVDLCNKLGVPQ